MLASYRRVFAKPGALAFSATALVARLPISMMTLGIILLVSSVSGSYALAGQVSAAYIVGNALFAIPQGRLADRFGQGLVLYVDSVVFALSSSLMIVSITQEWALVWPHVWGALAGCLDPADRCHGARALGAHPLLAQRTAHRVRRRERRGRGRVRHRSRSGDLPATSWAPEAGLVLAVAVGTVGALALAVQRRTEPPAHPHDTAKVRSPMPWVTWCR